MKIGNIALRSDVVLAPLAGYSDVGFRSICVKYGVGLTYTEMVSAKG
ncbi:MAG: tRNA-dihydrouridine synthase, partial [Clostridia bacterium]|nr:tRNA-dihydrouridine synthase [Clostridia bacterium]